MLGAMRTLAALLFIAGTAAVAVSLARTPTIADGRVVAADRLEDARAQGIPVSGMECDPHIPIGRRGAAFTCIATLASGATQVVEYTLSADGQYAPRPGAVNHAVEPRKPAPRDPWADRP